MTKIKLCGLKSLNDIEYANACMPDYVGFVFAPSKRQVSNEFALQMKQNLHSDIKTVGVFVNESMEKIKTLCQMGVIDEIQLHGDEDSDYIKELKKLVNNPIIRAIRVKETESIEKETNNPCDFFLLDTYTKGQYGGSGTGFDLDLIPEMNRPFFLAGGLDRNNIQAAIQKCQPFAVDLSSGIETDGVKDFHKMKEIIELVRG